jgi:hypothetical protein
VEAIQPQLTLNLALRILNFQIWLCSTKTVIVAHSWPDSFVWYQISSKVPINKYILHILSLIDGAGGEGSKTISQR